MKAILYPIAGPWPGRLAIVPRPRGGDWLEDEVKAWKTAGIDVVLSALTEEETEDLDLAQEAALSAANGVEFVSFSIPDRGVPESKMAALEVVNALESRLAEGKSVALHCRQGVGRSALLAASLLVAAGSKPEDAFKLVESGRGTPVPDTTGQREWVTLVARDMATNTPSDV